jgi:hypothetical protein
VVHGANWVDSGLPGAGNILTFNNGNRPGTADDYSSVEDIVPPVDQDGYYFLAPGEPFGPAAPDWVYSNPPSFYSGSIGGAFRMPNGNTLICEGTDQIIFEVNPDGQTVWVYFAPANVHRAPRYWEELADVSGPPADLAQLRPNYPNPFNPRTTIAFELAEEQQVTLEITSLAGRLITRLVDGFRPAGRQMVIWDGRNQDGRAVASGTYLIQLQAASFPQCRKAVLIR